MRYLDIPTKEGGYTRTGSRTPMQWDNSANKGFSSAPADKLYLPVDPSLDAPTVEDQAKDPDSLLNTVKALTKLRHEYRDLQADSSFEVVYAEKEEFPFVFKRGDLVVAVNPSDKKASASLSKKYQKVYEIGQVEIHEASLKMQPQSFAVLKYKLLN
jgi:maltose alpha-D-glucosyltransferase/alpha-amylase